MKQIPNNLSTDFFPKKKTKPDYLTYATAVVILDPPAAPIDNIISFFAVSIRRLGVIEDSGILRGAMKFTSAGSTLYALILPGIAKSSMPSFKTIPVLFPTSPLPNLETALKLNSIDNEQNI